MADSKKNLAITAEVIARATRDLAFRQQFLADPKALLIAAGAEIGAAVEIRALENTNRLRYIVLSADAAELTEAQLGSMAGGGATVVTNTVQTAAAQTTSMQVAVVSGVQALIAGVIEVSGVSTYTAVCN